mmetsp:Transcript_31973/g.52788  ORF Transcript_31973/g.52788 Transcript_31973/m.52788 type:complete len:268 (+) Transcript_31973:119-922(+)|eukprot:CAMPEP_0119020346 /NCGR_PEP_ID=MMETSP1176-20130426/23846_1 /TAXON_ID=265551 /ORGANISM="Synedropsis recta cf, Strain CCMP1620" /LENGTH=267 /DNA_ID=CAMNT_0006974759 /DNA_START=80 /DNA_END=883 /DNA_ORIENTATION=-
MSNEEEEEDQVHLVQTLLTVNEVFVYQIPPMKSSGGHRAEDWDLAKPLKTCTLTVERLDSACLIKLIIEKIKLGGVGVDTSLFAQSIIKVGDTNKLEYFLQQTVDSSRYFVLKIVDKTLGRTAHIGVGFRERDDASNFRLALQDYERSILREFKAEANHQKFEEQDGEETSDAAPELTQVSKLTLKEGEKIHIKLKGYEANENKEQKKATVSGGTVPLLKKPTGGGGAVPLLKKPPLAVCAEDELEQKDESAAPDDDDDEEWTDFQS